MPLILLSGLPSSGKTYRSKQILSNFQSRISSSTDPRTQKLKVVHINDDTLGLNRSVYDAGRREKDARAAFASAVKRELGKDTIVIADGMNYIKGYRYQMYCEAKEQGTGSCVLQPATPPSVCSSLNTLALGSNTGGYPPTQFDNLVYRHEEPNGLNRWDSPLFVVPHDDTDPPYDAIWDALIGSDGQRKIVRPHQATVLKKASEEGYLPYLERVCGDVVRQVEGFQKEQGGGGGTVLVGLEGGEEGEVQLPMDGVRGPQLQRLRRQFVAMNRVGEVEKRRVGRLFVEYLNDALQE
ncbi:Chromatin associated protein KTI12-like protein [Elsinoe fawcettii]|nr:Chromatin associated protein KTI12-like protein [Elsinoe fawcettii]